MKALLKKEPHVLFGTILTVLAIVYTWASEIGKAIEPGEDWTQIGLRILVATPLLVGLLARQFGFSSATVERETGQEVAVKPTGVELVGGGRPYASGPAADRVRPTNS